MRKTLAAVMVGCVLGAGARGWAQNSAKVSIVKMADTVMQQWPAGVVGTIAHPGAWGYEEGTLLDGITAVWRETGNKKYFAYVKSAVDKYITEGGTIKGYAAEGHTLDDIEMGRAVLVVYVATHEERYRKAAEFLEAQLAVQPRTASGGYWHKQIYPNQMWLDGAYMAEPFRAAYAALFQQPKDFDDIAKQLLLMDEHMRHKRTELMLHGWDESKQMAWADPKTGLSPEVWSRAMGWYAMALVDVLDWFPKEHPQRSELVAALNRTAEAIVHYQDKKSGLWWQVMDKGGKAGNFKEASASCMYVYALAKGARMGYLAQSDAIAAGRGWQGIQKEFVMTAPDGGVVLNGTVKVGGLGGTPYRSGKYEYYVGEKTGAQDAKGVGAYLMAGAEMAAAAQMR
jgi:unsaturated rhamnogalacturonyl hydrolase